MDTAKTNIIKFSGSTFRKFLRAADDKLGQNHR